MNIIAVVGMGLPPRPAARPAGSVVQQLGGPPLPPTPNGRRSGRDRAARPQAGLSGSPRGSMRKLLERIKGLPLLLRYSVRDFIVESDSITTNAQGTSSRYGGAALPHNADRPHRRRPWKFPSKASSVHPELHRQSS
jgi:hypothetical protein